ncbi:hypothetical protein HJC23_008542 [Cyclotella cryptica]|uniref:Uncharacterized protein n=1 Tax=Cyclotella cryptica TaxID=29204 RepID=A0ABD3QXD9_9STRA|eukprot:CCRYP_001303-RA/>CCRYP_001303-RA protein AED:0.03 eAED:0.03 QI:124/1/1/1/1/1/2/266/355
MTPPVSDIERIPGPEVSTYGSVDSSKPIYHDGPSDSSKHSGEGMSMNAPTLTSTQQEQESSNGRVNSTNETITEAAYLIGNGHSPNTELTIDSHSNHPAQQEHLQKTRQYYRDMMLGVNDGLVSALLLVAGVVGGGMDVTAVLLTAVSGAIAGAISMFAGEYIATKSQNEVMRGEIKLELEHITKYPSEEMQELSSLLSLIGIPSSSSHLSDMPNDSEEARASREDVRELKQLLTKYYRKNPDALLKIMIALELGVIEDEIRSPFVAGATSFCCFFVGALPSTVPFAIVSNPNVGLLAAGIATGLVLSVAGAIKSWASRGDFFYSALENLSIAAAGGTVAYGIGVVFDSLTGDDN